MMLKLSLRRASTAGATALATVLALSQMGTPALAGPPPRPQGGPLPDLVVGASRMKSTVLITNQTFGANECEVVEGCARLPGQVGYLVADPNDLDATRDQIRQRLLRVRQRIRLTNNGFELARREEWRERRGHFRDHRTRVD